MQRIIPLFIALAGIACAQAQESQFNIGAAVSFSPTEPDNAIGRFHCSKGEQEVISGYLTEEDDDKYLYYGNYFYRRRDESRVTIDPDTQCRFELYEGK